jgi:5-methyltetrahydropteroyltriglutamate--homocysteine methyltransferase
VAARADTVRRHVSEGKIVVLGLVTTKTPYCETVEELEARVRQATRYFPLERLSICPQCGFSTSIVGNAITVEDEQHKLHTLVETAERI